MVCLLSSLTIAFVRDDWMYDGTDWVQAFFGFLRNYSSSLYLFWTSTDSGMGIVDDTLIPKLAFITCHSLVIHSSSGNTIIPQDNDGETFTLICEFIPSTRISHTSPGGK